MVWTPAALRPFQEYIWTYQLVILVPVCKAGSRHAWFMQANCNTRHSQLDTKNTMWGVGLYTSISSKIIIIFRVSNSKAKHRVKHTEKFIFNLHGGSKRKIHAAILTHQKRFPDVHNCHLRSTCIGSDQMRMYLLASTTIGAPSIRICDHCIMLLFSFHFCTSKTQFDKTGAQNFLSCGTLWCQSSAPF